MKFSAVGEVDASAAARLERLTLEEHPRLEKYKKALSFMLRFARDAHLDCAGGSLVDWLSPDPNDRCVTCSGAVGILLIPKQITSILLHERNEMHWCVTSTRL